MKLKIKANRLEDDFKDMLMQKFADLGWGVKDRETIGNSYTSHHWSIILYDPRYPIPDVNQHEDQYAYFIAYLVGTRLDPNNYPIMFFYDTRGSIMDVYLRRLKKLGPESGGLDNFLEHSDEILKIIKKINGYTEGEI